MMLRDFTKLQTFIVVVQEKSFSKASAKLGISQPAVTQQIKFIEEYYNTKIIIRKKNKIRLTQEGEILLLIAQEILKNLHKYQHQIMQIIHYDEPIRIACSHTIGHSIFPKCLPTLQQKIYSDTHFYISTSLQAIRDLQNNLCNLALVESYIPNEEIIYREWLEDEMVLISNLSLPPRLIRYEQLYSYTWLELEMTKQVIPEIYKYLKAFNLNRKQLNVKMRFDSLNEIKQFMLENKESKIPYIAFLPYTQVKSELQSRIFFSTKIPDVKLKRKLYLTYLKKYANHPLICAIAEHIIFNTKVSLN